MQPSMRYMVTVALIVALGGFLMGFDASVISGVVTFIEPEFALTKIELGWAVSCLTLTSTLAMMVSGPLSDRWGRRRFRRVHFLLVDQQDVTTGLLDGLDQRGDRELERLDDTPCVLDLGLRR